MEVLLEVMLRCRDRASEHLRLYEEGSDKCSLNDEWEYTFTEGWVEAMNYMIETAETLLYGNEEDN